MLLLLALPLTALASQAPPSLVATEVARLNGTDAELTLSFTTVYSLGSGEQLAFFDGGHWRIEVLDGQLKRVGAFGRRGQGPGELSVMAASLHALRLGRQGDSIWVYDEGLRRISLFGPDRRLMRTLPIPLPDGKSVASYTVLGLLPGSRILVAARSPTDSRSFALRVINADGTVDRELESFRPDSSAVLRTRGFVAVPFRSRFRRAVSPDGSLIATIGFAASARDRGQLHVLVRTSDGVVRHDSRFAVAAPPVTRAMVDSAVGTLPPGPGSSRVEGSTEADVRRHVPSTADPFTHGVVGDDGTLWLRRTSIDWTAGKPIAWAWVAPDGTWRGELPLAARETIVAVAGSDIWTVTIDLDGAAVVRRLRVRSR